MWTTPLIESLRLGCKQPLIIVLEKNYSGALNKMKTILREVFKVIYAPHKAFKEIAQNLKYIGPISIMILFIVGNMALSYTLLSKIYVEQTIPIGTSEKCDEWTENATLWDSTLLGIEIADNNNDFINTTSEQMSIPFYGLIITYYGYRTYYGNRSIQFSINYSTIIWMLLDDIGPIDCSESGYSIISMRIKGLFPAEKPKSAVIYLFSTRGCPNYDFTSQLSFNSTVWDNVQIPLRTSGWQNVSNTDWSDINGLKLEFTWDTPQNITLLIDGLFFRGVFNSLIVYHPESLFMFSVNAFMQFTINWVVLSGLVYIISKTFRGKATWKMVLILIGFTLITLFIQAIIYAAAFSTIPPLYYKLELLGKIKGESENAREVLLSNLGFFSVFDQFFSIAMLVWTIVLCTIATRAANEFSWGKSVLIAVISYYASAIILSFLLA
jgi:hypothetical protein